jgi:hypothetical protein
MTTWVISSGRDEAPMPFRLTDGTWLLAAQTLGVRESSTDGQLWLTTLQSVYRWQASEEDASWLVRWEYDRDAGHYPAAHVHVNATGRVAIEDVIEFLITEQGLEPISDNWNEVLVEARAHFRRIQGRRR